MVEVSNIKGYFICEQCAKQLGGTLTKKLGSTISKQTCKTCDGRNQVEEYIIPYVDYDWSLEKPVLNRIGINAP